MIEYRVNLLRGRVPSPAQRRNRYWAMIAYLGVTGLLLVVSLGFATARLLDARRLRQQSSVLEERFLATHEGEANIRSYAWKLHRQLTGQQTAIQAVDRQLQADVRLAPLLKALVFSLPPGAILRQFSLGGENQITTVTFEVLIAGGYTSQMGNPADLLARWGQSADISDQIKGLTFLGSQVEGIMSSGDTIWRFSGTLTGSGT